MDLGTNSVSRFIDGERYLIGIDGSCIALHGEASQTLYDSFEQADNLEEAKQRYFAAYPHVIQDKLAAHFDDFHEAVTSVGAFAPAMRGPGADYSCGGKRPSPILQELYGRLHNENRIMDAHVEITGYCNLDCSICYMKETGEFYSLNDKAARPAGPTRDHLTVEEFQNIIDEFRDEGTLDLTITGGEPLLHPQMTELLDILAGEEIFVSINTNGTVMTEAIMDRLEKVRLKLLDISVYGFSEETYEKTTEVRNFKFLLKTIRALKKRNLPFRLKYLLQRHNTEDVTAFREFVRAEKIQHFISDGKLQPTGAGHIPHDSMVPNEKLTELYQIGAVPFVQVRKPGEAPGCASCVLGNTRINISSKGNVYPCEFIRVKIGNINQQSLDDIWHRSEEIAEVREWDYTAGEKCQSCEVKHHCNRCPAMSAVGRLPDVLFSKDHLRSNYTPQCELAHTRAEFERTLTS